LSEQIVGTWIKELGATAKSINEYRNNGSFTWVLDMQTLPDLHNERSGTWKVEDSFFWFNVEELTVLSKSGNFKPSTTKITEGWKCRKIISVTDKEFKSQFDDQNPNIEFRATKTTQPVE
jgi:hypothetical protein